MNNLGNKLSKIDRVLVSHHVIDVWPNSHMITLPREYSDHTPILFSSLSVDFGATPFKLYNSWIMHKISLNWSLLTVLPPKNLNLKEVFNKGILFLHFSLFLLWKPSMWLSLKPPTITSFMEFKWGKIRLISHLQYADDALILGEWSVINAKNLSRILTCFHLASGLKVNFNKINLFGVGLSNIELNVIASSLGCLASQYPCSYWGLPVGAHMSRCVNWNPLVERFQKRISKWKANTLSFGGRLTLIKSVLGSLGVYYFSIFKAPKKIIHKLESIRRKFFWGGSSLRDTFPRLYRLETMQNCLVFERAPSAQTIVPVASSNVNSFFHHQEVLQLNDGPILQPTIPFAGPTFHWAWWRTLRSEEENMELCELQDLLLNLNLSMEHDTWEFTPGHSRWNKLLSSKVNTMSLSVYNQRLPPRANLNKRGIDLDLVLCPICNSDIETEVHVFVTCSIAHNIWKDAFAWWHLSSTPPQS
nr:RNA-directed DNA polymerase, eukaryota, reverse transcriptase zinc-binding domain protein [Tanacetum cinerariifolium]